MREGWLTTWMVAVIFMRELVITGLRGFLETEGIAFGADWLGKVKMVLQCAVLIAVFVVLPYPVGPLPLIRDVLIWVTVLVAAVSGIQYLVKATILLGRSTG
jgi:phosphatidylglycerophosphate synthase